MPKRNSGAFLKYREDRKIYEIQWFDAGRRRRHSTGTDSLKDAEKQLTEHITRSHRSKGRAHPDERIIGGVIADYAREHGQFVKSKDTLQKCITELAPFWGNKAVDDAREETCRQYMDFRNQQYKKRQKEKLEQLKARDKKKKIVRQYPPVGNVKPSVVARELSVLAAAINHDFKRGRLSTPVHVWKPSFNNLKDRWLTRKEVGAILRKAKARPDSRDYLPLFILIGIYTGARHSAILGLRWPQIDLENHLIDFRTGEPTKNKGRALIPIPARLLTFLRLARKRGNANGFVVHRSQQPIQSLKKGFGEACAKAGVKGVTPHTLRHTAASWMAQKGVSFAKIARYLGHSDSRTTERIYAHHAPDYLKDAADSFR